MVTAAVTVVVTVVVGVPGQVSIVDPSRVDYR